MWRILALGAAIGVPLAFATCLGMVLAAGARGPGALFIAGWTAMIGGPFIGSGVVLSKRLGELGLAKRPVQPDLSSVAPERAA